MEEPDAGIIQHRTEIPEIGVGKTNPFACRCQTHTRFRQCVLISIESDQQTRSGQSRANLLRVSAATQCAVHIRPARIIHERIDRFLAEHRNVKRR